jgi:hypothetical protein
MPTLVEIREEIAAKSKALHEIFAQAGPERDMAKVTLIEGDSAAKAAEIKRRNDELTALGKKRDEPGRAGRAGPRPTPTPSPTSPVGGSSFPNGGKAAEAERPHAEGGKSLRRMFAESKAFESFRSNGREAAVRVSLSAESTPRRSSRSRRSARRTSGSACSR